MTDFTNKKIDKLLILENIGKNSNNYYLWRCRCDCGNEVVRPSYYFKKNPEITKCCKECAKKDKKTKWKEKVKECPVKVNI